MTISGYAWGHIVTPGPQFTSWDNPWFDTHPRTLRLAQSAKGSIIGTRLEPPDYSGVSGYLSYATWFFIPSGENPLPVFQIDKVVAASLRAIVRRARLGSIPFSTRAS
jgi:hypothetical protein